jgi:hypothetical protein
LHLKENFQKEGLNQFSFSSRKEPELFHLRLYLCESCDLIYANPALLKWFTDEYTKRVKSKLDMGKSCIRFKNFDEIPYKLIAELMKKISVKDWVYQYETLYKSKSKK